MPLSDTLERIGSSQCTVGDLTRSAGDEKLQSFEKVWPAVSVTVSEATMGFLNSNKAFTNDHKRLSNNFKLTFNIDFNQVFTHITGYDRASGKGRERGSTGVIRRV